MKKNNKKGFTIVELVIVIAVIAILSAVLIPTFGGIIDQANESAALQKASNAYKTYLMENKADDSDLVIGVDGKYWFTVTNGKISDEAADNDPGNHHGNKVILEENGADITLYVAGTCTDANKDHKCDKCSYVLSVCDTAGTDGKCSVCGK